MPGRKGQSPVVGEARLEKVEEAALPWEEAEQEGSLNLGWGKRGYPQLDEGERGV